MCVLVNVFEGVLYGGREGFHDTADDRSSTACLLIIVTVGGRKVLKEVKRKTVSSKWMR